ncbi:hypothetical protein R6Q59_031206 [Mikania micrantha]
MRWRDRFVFFAEAIYKAQAETGEIKGHYLNAAAVIDRQKNHGMHFCVLAKALRMSGGDHIHSGTVVGKLEGEREITLDFVYLLRDDFIEKDRSRGIYFTQDWVSLPGVLPVASRGIHVWHMPALTKIFGDDFVLQFGGGTLGHPWGNASGAVANRVALETCVQARNEGRDLATEDNRRLLLNSPDPIVPVWGTSGEAVECCTLDGESPVAESITSLYSDPSSMGHVESRVNQQGPPCKAKYSRVKGHYLNATAGNCDEMMKGAAFARELGVPIVMHDYLTWGFIANTTLAHNCRDNGLLLHIHQCM